MQFNEYKYTMFCYIYIFCFHNFCISMASQLFRQEGVMNHVVYLGSNATIPCFERERTEDVSEFHWLHHAYQPLSSNLRYGRRPSGDLIIADVKPDDSSIFICKANMTNNEVIEVYHHIKVIQHPMLGLHIHFTYDLGECPSQFEILAVEHINAVLKGAICQNKMCKQGIIHSNCYINEASAPSLKITVPVVFPEIPTTTCNTNCTEAKITILKEKLIKEITTIVLKGKPLKLPRHEHLQPSAFDGTTKRLCSPGYEFFKDHCSPCAPGNFLDKGFCNSCPRNFYTSKFAATECEPCQQGETLKTGAKSEGECIVINNFFVYVVSFVFITTVALSCFAFCWIICAKCRNSFIGSCFGRIYDICCCNWRKLKYSNITKTEYESVNKTSDTTENKKNKYCQIEEIPGSSATSESETTSAPEIELKSSKSLPTVPSAVNVQPVPVSFPRPPLTYRNNDQEDSNSSTERNRTKIIQRLSVVGGGDSFNPEFPGWNKPLPKTSKFLKREKTKKWLENSTMLFNKPEISV